MALKIHGGWLHLAAALALLFGAEIWTVIWARQAHGLAVHLQSLRNELQHRRLTEEDFQIFEQAISAFYYAMAYSIAGLMIVAALFWYIAAKRLVPRLCRKQRTG